MDWQTKVSYINHNHVTVARQIDYTFQQLWGNVFIGGMHPIGQILKYDEKKEIQGRGSERFHATIHFRDSPRIDQDNDEDVVKVIDKHWTCALPDTTEFPELHKLVSTVRTHHHTFICRKKSGVTCRFHARWPLPNILS